MESNKIFLGDCLEILRQLPDNSVDAIITDPPYASGGRSISENPYRHLENMSKQTTKQFIVQISSAIQRIVVHGFTGASCGFQNVREF